MKRRADVRHSGAANQTRDAIDKNAPRADSCGLIQKHAIGLLQLLA
jgi:hypothetical protein